ncbi:MAG: hypothetical protein ACLGHN_09760 [Bacteriovoracia bacterium]
MRLLFLALAFLSSSAFARSYFPTPFIVGGVTAATITGTHAAIYHSLLRMELKGWADKETGSTVKLESTCDVEGEFHLVGNHRQNSLLLGVTNSTATPTIVKMKGTRFTYNDVRTRYPGFATEAQDYKLDPGWWILTWIPFPSKDEFQEVDKITVEVPLLLGKENKECILRTTFTKKERIKSEEFSYTAFEFVFDGGASLEQYGNIKRMGSPDGMFGLEFNVFPHPHHGAGLIFNAEHNFDKSKKSRIYRNFEKGENYSALSSYVGLQYLYRHFFTSSLNLQYGIGFGHESLDDTDEETPQTEANFLSFSQKLMLQWNFYKFHTPHGEIMDLITGAGVLHMYNPGARIGGEHLDGHRLGLLLRFGMGF